MATVLLVAAILAAGLACPAMMWWQRRRGRQVTCCIAPEGVGSEGGAGLEELGRRQEALSARLADLHGQPGRVDRGAAGQSSDG